MSGIGQTFSRYRDALDWSVDRYEADRGRSMDAMRQFYPRVLSRPACSHDCLRTRTSHQWLQALQNLRYHCGRGEQELHFAAIDGTCGREQLSEMLVFYGASYAQGGTLKGTPFPVQMENANVQVRQWLESHSNRTEDAP